MSRSKRREMAVARCTFDKDHEYVCLSLNRSLSSAKEYEYSLNAVRSQRLEALVRLPSMQVRLYTGVEPRVFHSAVVTFCTWLPEQGPSATTEWAGMTPSSNGIRRAVVSVSKGYDVLWPVPTVSTMIVMPSEPPSTYAEPVLFGSVITASPEVKTTHLCRCDIDQYHAGIHNQVGLTEGAVRCGRLGRSSAGIWHRSRSRDCRAGRL